MVSSLRFNLSDQSGVTLVELMVVIVIIAIIAAIALMQRGSADSQFKRQNVATQLKNAFERARFDSVKRRAGDGSQPAKVIVSPSSYTLRIYNKDANGVGVAQDTVTSLPTGIVIGLYPSGTPSSQEVVFNMRGEATTSPSPQFYICNISCSSPGNASANLLIVTPTGTVNLLPGNATLPTFGVPTMTNVNASTGISNTVVVP